MDRRSGSVERNYVRSGKFWIDGVRLPDILAKFPTPCYIYSASVIKENYQQEMIRRILQEKEAKVKKR